MLKLVARIKIFYSIAHYFYCSNKIIFRSVSSEILDPSAKFFFVYK